jgi:hypothetical protein
MTCLEELGDLNEVLDDNSKVVSIGTRGSTRNQNETAGGNGEPKTAPETTAAPGKETEKTPKAQKAQNPQNGNGTSSDPQTVAKMSEAQKRAIYNLSRRRGISLEELKKLAMEGYNVALEDLSSIDASKFIRQLQQSA